MKRHLTGLVLLLMLSRPLFAQEMTLPNAPPTDSYHWVGQYGIGGLDLWRKTEGLEGAAFRINTVNERGNVCDLSGTIRGEQARLNMDEGVCVVRFSQSGERIRVSNASPQMCMTFCGSGAVFEGDYRAVRSECTDAARQRTEQLFHRQYRAQHYVQAVSTLRQMWQACAPSMHWLDEMKLRNNLAVTYAKMGDSDQCIRILQPYRKEILAPNPIAVREQPVSYLFEADYRVQIKHARYNWNLCQK